MNYNKIYQNLINKRVQTPPTNTEFTENHHIIPRSIGGIDDKSNIVTLTTREHFIAHLLLVKIHWHDAQKRSKMLFALNYMKISSSQRRYFNSRLFEYYRNQFISDVSDNIRELKWYTDGMSEKRIRNEEIPDGWYSGRTRTFKEHTLETKTKISVALKGRVPTAEIREKLSTNNFSRRDPIAQRNHASKAGSIGGSKQKSNTHKENISNAIKSLISYTDGNVNIKQHKDLPPPVGFRRGMTKKVKRK